jgi:hypothetical protein
VCKYTRSSDRCYISAFVCIFILKTNLRYWAADHKSTWNRTQKLTYPALFPIIIIRVETQFEDGIMILPAFQPRPM